VFYRISIAQKLLQSDFWTTNDRNIVTPMRDVSQLCTDFCCSATPNLCRSSRKARRSWEKEEVL